MRFYASVCNIETVQFHFSLNRLIFSLKLFLQFLNRFLFVSLDYSQVSAICELWFSNREKKTQNQINGFYKHILSIRFEFYLLLLCIRLKTKIKPNIYKYKLNLFKRFCQTGNNNEKVDWKKNGRKRIR